MKKIFVILASAMLLLSVASCKSVEDKARDYAAEIEALHNEGKDVEALKKTAEMLDWYNGLSDEDKAIVDNLDL